MSFGSGDARKRPGLFDSFKAAMSPVELPPDDGKPIEPPRTVLVATVLAMLSGIVFILIGGYSVATTDQALDTAVANYNSAISDCTQKFGGIGDAVVVPAAPAEDVTAAQTCQQYTPLTDETISSAKTNNIMISAIVVLIGVIAAGGGWFLRKGAKFSRLAVGLAVVLSVVLTMLFQASNLFTLAGTLLMIVAVMLCYIGKGAVFFARHKARRTV
jgi:hypothetical protein